MTVLHLIGPNDTAPGIAIKYGVTVSALKKANGRANVESLQYARLFLDLQHLKIPIPNPDGELEELHAADPQMVLDLHTEKSIRTVSYRLFINHDWATSLLEENGFSVDWAVWAYKEDLRAARGKVLRDPVLLLTQKLIREGPPLKAAWTSDDQRSCCSTCEKKFAPKWNFCGNHKHHCRSCGEVFCGSCSDQYAKLPMVGPAATKTPVRVCNQCARIDWDFNVTRYRVDDNLLETVTSPPDTPKPTSVTHDEYRTGARVSVSASESVPDKHPGLDPPAYCGAHSNESTDGNIGTAVEMAAAFAPPAYESSLLA